MNKKLLLNKKIINEIKNGQFKMKSKMYFVLRTVLFSLITLFTALFVIFFISFIIFILKTSGVWFLPSFGFGKIGILFTSLPWLLILTALILIIVLELLVKKFSFAYRRPILYSILAILFFVILGNFIVFKTPMHDDLFLRAQKGKLPIAGDFYRDFGAPNFSQVHNGIVFEIVDNGFDLETFRGEILNVVIDSKTNFSSDGDIRKNDRVLVLGERKNEVIEAVDIRKIDSRAHPRKFMHWNKK